MRTLIVCLCVVHWLRSVRACARLLLNVDIDCLSVFLLSPWLRSVGVNANLLLNEDIAFDIDRLSVFLCMCPVGFVQFV